MSGSVSPTACYVDAAGIHSPPFTSVLSYLQGQVQNIFGADDFLGNDAQDQQILGVFAEAIYDTNSMAIAVYQSYSPSTAQGVGLSSVVKINGLARELPTNSSVDLLLTGVAGTTITNGVVRDATGNQWLLPPTVSIPFIGQVTATATAAVAGNVSAPAGTVSTIATPTFGWQTATNLLDAVPGNPLEGDPALRLRQTHSTMIPSVTALDGTIGAVLEISGVTRLQAYENDTNLTDSNGLTSHSIALIVEGGDATAIATAIAKHKTPGASTIGTTTVSITDAYGIPRAINFFRPTEVVIQVIIHLTALNGYTSIIGQEVVTSVVNFLNALPIGQSVFNSRAEFAALSIPPADSATFNLTSILLARGVGTPAEQDIGIAFNEAALGMATTVTLSIP